MKQIGKNGFYFRNSNWFIFILSKKNQKYTREKKFQLVKLSIPQTTHRIPNKLIVARSVYPAFIEVVQVAVPSAIDSKKFHHSVYLQKLLEKLAFLPARPKNHCYLWPRCLALTNSISRAPSSSLLLPARLLNNLLRS